MNDVRRITIEAWMMTRPGEALEKQSYAAPAPPAGELLVEVAGCGVCHTDLSFLRHGVKTRAAPPLTLGHEISGTVVEVGEGVSPELLGRPVIVPAVLPCGTCDVCRSGRRRICRAQVMPGNDRHGGFATHVPVPARYVCPVEAAVLDRHELWELAIVSDAVATPFQAVKRSGLAADDLAIVIGTGGIGTHAVQVAAAAGARVIALDIDASKLAVAAEHGAGAVVEVADLSARDVRAAVKERARELGAPRLGWKIFETSGTLAGQETAFGLLGFGASVAIVGFTLERPQVRLSNLMAFDAEMFGIWGADPELYPEILAWLAAGRLQVRPFVEKHPLAEINRVLDAADRGELARRAVMVP